ncbi:MAG TPA: peptidylprolyl isomerase [Steroidobacteraceae bacterium]|nr:peptidylprolyl isomerase [Steroidobacteraceae bacterium]
MTALLTGVGVLCGCQQKGAGPATAATAGAPVAVVNGTPISRDFFEFYVMRIAGRPSKDLPPDQRERALDNLIRAELVVQQAEKDGITRDPQTQDAVELARLNVIEQTVSENYLKDKKPTEQELRAEYETQLGALPRQEYHARHILVATQPFAQKLIQELDKGANFVDLAKRESMDSSKDNGGDLGWFTPDHMVKPFAEAVVALKPGEYTHQPVQTEYGWHIIQLEGTRDLSPPSFDSVRDRLAQVVLTKKFKAYTDQLMKAAKVEKTG